MLSRSRWCLGEINWSRIRVVRARQMTQNGHRPDSRRRTGHSASCFGVSTTTMTTSKRCPRAARLRKYAQNGHAGLSHQHRDDDQQGQPRQLISCIPRTDTPHTYGTSPPPFLLVVCKAGGPRWTAVNVENRLIEPRQCPYAWSVQGPGRTTRAIGKVSAH